MTTQSLVWVLGLALLGCTGTSQLALEARESSNSVANTASPFSGTLESLPTENVYGSVRCDGCVVTYSLSKAVLTLEGLPIRVLSFTEVPLPSSQRLGGGGVCLVGLRDSGANGYSNDGGSVRIQPKGSLSWGQVASEADLDIQTN